MAKTKQTVAQLAIMTGLVVASVTAFSAQADQLAEKYNITEFSLENLYINGLISQTDRVKILGNGELKGKYSFKVNAISDKAKSAVEAAGGTVEIVK